MKRKSAHEPSAKLMSAADTIADANRLKELLRHQGLRPVFQVASFRIVAPFTLAVTFDGGLLREIDFQPMLVGPLFGPLAELEMFNQVRLDPEVKTLVWPNGADFDPETLHNWPDYVEALAQRVREWQNGLVAVCS